MASQAPTPPCKQSLPIPRCQECTGEGHAVAGLTTVRATVHGFSDARLDAAAKLMHSSVDHLQGDAADWILMIASTMVFVFMAMQLYRLYLLIAYPEMLH